MKLLIEVPDMLKEGLTKTAILYGFARKQPTKSWNEAEHKEAIRYAIERIISMQFSNKIT